MWGRKGNNEAQSRSYVAGGRAGVGRWWKSEREWQWGYLWWLGDCCNLVGLFDMLGALNQTIGETQSPDEILCWSKLLFRMGRWRRMSEWMGWRMYLNMIPVVFNRAPRLGVSEVAGLEIKASITGVKPRSRLKVNCFLDWLREYDRCWTRWPMLRMSLTLVPFDRSNVIEEWFFLKKEGKKERKVRPERKWLTGSSSFRSKTGDRQEKSGVDEYINSKYSSVTPQHPSWRQDEVISSCHDTKTQASDSPSCHQSLKTQSQKSEAHLSHPHQIGSFRMLSYSLLQSSHSPVYKKLQCITYSTDQEIHQAFERQPLFYSGTYFKISFMNPSGVNFHPFRPSNCL